MTGNVPKPASKEFIWLIAMLMSLVALSIDGMLPALEQIGLELGTRNPNDNQLVVSAFILGMAIGLIFFGPVSDSFGRKRSLYLGISIVLIGTLLSILSPNLNIMLIGRVLQGIGGASCRVVSLAMVRDLYSGSEMARIMSLIMLVFIMVPALAPSIGQLIVMTAGWRWIFGFIFLYGMVGVLWLRFRQQETLPSAKRLDFSIRTIWNGIVETITHPVAIGFAISAGFMFGAFIGYLSSAQQILQIQYQLGDSFSVYFGILSIAFGVSSFSNSKLVMWIPLERLCLIALTILVIATSLFVLYAWSESGNPPLFAMMGFIVVTYLCLGIIFGSFNALAVEPLGHIAGVAASTIAFVQTFISALIGGLIGQLYNGTVLPVVLGYLCCTVLTLMIVIRLQTIKLRSLSVKRP